MIEALAERGRLRDGAGAGRALRGGGRPVGLASVYRALTALEEAGLVRPADLGPGERRYELVHDDGSHHHHVVCEHCGRTIAFSDPEPGGRDRRASASASGRQLDAHDVVLRGKCRDCLAARAR